MDATGTRLVIDLNHLSWRVFSTQGTLVTTTGEKTGVVFGVLRTLKMLCERFKISQVIMCADESESFRTELLTSYKRSRRERTVEQLQEKNDFYDQFARMKAMMECLGVPVLAYPKLEADDLCAIVCRKLPFHGTTVVVSGDKDLLQLVDQNTVYYHPFYDKVVSLTGEKLPVDTSTYPQVWGKAKVITPEFFSYKSEKIGKCVPFDRWLLYRSLVGDSSDELSGIKGIGESTACAIVSCCSTVQEVIDKRDSLPINVRQKAALSLEELQLQYNLIDLNLIVNFSAVDTVVQSLKEQMRRTKRDEEGFKHLVLRYQFASVFGELNKYLKTIPCFSGQA